MYGNLSAEADVLTEAYLAELCLTEGADLLESMTTDANPDSTTDPLCQTNVVSMDENEGVEKGQGLSLRAQTRVRDRQGRDAEVMKNGLGRLLTESRGTLMPGWKAEKEFFHAATHGLTALPKDLTLRGSVLNGVLDDHNNELNLHTGTVARSRYTRDGGEWIEMPVRDLESVLTETPVLRPLVNRLLEDLSRLTITPVYAARVLGRQAVDIMDGPLDESMRDTLRDGLYRPVHGGGPGRGPAGHPMG